MRRIVPLLCAIILTFSACAASRQDFSTSTTRQPAQSSSEPSAPSSTPTMSTDARVAGSAGRPADISMKKVSDTQTLPETANVERKIIRNAELTIESQNPEEAFRKVASMAEAKGGFVVTSEATQPEGAAEPSRTSVSVTLRIPAAQFDSTVEEIRKAGDRVLQDKRTGQDVTEEYIDLQARLQAKKALEAQFLEIMKQAHNVSDALEVQRQLAEVRGEIEQIEGRKRFLENQSSLSTIKVNITPPVQIIGTGGGVKEALRDGLAAATMIVLVLVRVIVAALPLALIVGLPTWLIVRYWIRRSRRAKLT